MNILILDDQPRRYDRLIPVLNELGIQREMVDIVGSATDARRLIEAKSYDLLILDILVPLWPESEQSSQHSIDLLFEIREHELNNPPRYILGITADREVTADASAQFEEWCWSVLDYSESNDEWIRRTANCAKYVAKQCYEPEPQLPRVDLVIICALGEPEYSEILKLPWNWSSARPIDEINFVRDGHIDVDGRQISVCAARATRMGMVATAIQSTSLISKLRPRVVAMTGICAGVRGKVNMGDVLFADPAWDFQSGKRIREKGNAEFSIRPHQLAANARLRALAEQVRDDRSGLNKIAADFDGQTPGTTRLVIGPVASGSAVLADGEVIQQVKDQHQELLGVEMEIYGLFAAAHSAPSPQPLCLALKGVCDFADPDKQDGFQRYAAYASARVLELFVARFASSLFA